MVPRLSDRTRPSADALRRSGEIALSVLGALQDTSVLVFDRELRFVMAAGGALERHGYAPADLEGRRVADALRPDMAERFLPRYAAALDGARARLSHRSLDGARIYEVDVAPVERDGEVIGGMAISRDVTERRQAERALARSAREYRDLAEKTSDVITRTDAGGVYTYVSPSCERLYGWRVDQMVGRPAGEFIHPDEREQHRAVRDALAAGEEERVAERRMLRPDGSHVWVESRWRALRGDDGGFVGVQTSARDISDRKAAELARRIADQHFRTAFDNALVGVALVRPDGAWLRVNDALCAMVGYSGEELSRMTFQDITHPDDLDADLSLVEQVLAGERVGYQMEKRYLHRSGETIWALLSVALVRDDDGAPLHFISQVLDISQSKRQESELRRLATEDGLTGLRNRRAFEEQLAAHLGLLGRHDGPSALLFLDVDDFKTVNDTRGHHAGDELLKQIARALGDRLRSTDLAARLGGDEFAVLLPFTDEDGARRVADDLERALAAVRVRASIGAARLEAGLSQDEALRRADEAMYRVKQTRRASAQSNPGSAPRPRRRHA